MTDLLDGNRRMWDAVERGDMAAAGAYIAADAWFQAAGDLSGIGGGRGAEAFAALWSEWSETFEDFEASLAELVPIAEDRIMAVIDHRGRGRGSGAAVSGTLYYSGWFRDGLLVRGVLFTDRAEAERALRQD